jgi:hypothetical protein
MNGSLAYVRVVVVVLSTKVELAEDPFPTPIIVTSAERGDALLGLPTVIALPPAVNVAMEMLETCTA